MTSPSIDLSTILVVCYVAILHWFADFYCQTDRMALAKHSSNKWLTIHVATYTVLLLMCTLVNVPLWCLLNGALHWVTDYFTSRWTSRLWKAERRHAFFVVIGLDQLIHLCTLTLTAWWLW